MDHSVSKKNIKYPVWKIWPDLVDLVSQSKIFVGMILSGRVIVLNGFAFQPLASSSDLVSGIQ